MLINYVTFEVDTDDREAFDEWYGRLAEDARQEEGCILYVYLKDPHRPTRGVTVAAWRSEEDIAAHRQHPSHIELVALGSSKWGMRDMTVHSFRDVGDYRVSTRPAIDAEAGTNDAGRQEMHDLVQAFLSARQAEPPRAGS